jgi:hypothetical protein
VTKNRDLFDILINSGTYLRPSYKVRDLINGLLKNQLINFVTEQATQQTLTDYDYFHLYHKLI